jgi:REP element-mobilizing transposase RayT
MKFEPGHLYHVYNQGNNRQVLFRRKGDYGFFLDLTMSCLKPNAEILAYALMPNHFHFMIQTDGRCADKLRQGGIQIDPVTNAFRKMLSGYAKGTNVKYGTSGSMFRQKTKAKSVGVVRVLTEGGFRQNDYCFNCFYYIHQNPIKAGLVDKLEDWEFSSFPEYSGKKASIVCNIELARQYGLFDPATFYALCHGV